MGLFATTIVLEYSSTRAHIYFVRDSVEDPGRLAAVFEITLFLSESQNISTKRVVLACSWFCNTSFDLSTELLQSGASAPFWHKLRASFGSRLHGFAGSGAPQNMKSDRWSWCRENPMKVGLAWENLPKLPKIHPKLAKMTRIHGLLVSVHVYVSPRNTLTRTGNPA